MVSLMSSTASIEKSTVIPMLSDIGSLEAVLIKSSKPSLVSDHSIEVSSNIKELPFEQDVVKVSLKSRWSICLRFRSMAEYQISIRNSRMETTSDKVVFRKGAKFLSIPINAFEKPYEIKLLRRYTIKSGVWKVYNHIEYLDSHKAIVLAYHKDTGDKVVIKRLSKNQKEHSIQNILVELESIQELGGAVNAIKFLEVYESKEEVSIVMEHFSSITLTDLISQREVSEHQALDIMTQLLEFLVDINRRSFAHRDLKPDNILIKEKKEEKRYSIRVIDFGLAQNMMVPVSQMVNKYCGTPGFAAPEIYQAADYSASIDVFSLGCIFYALLTGKLLFKPEKNKQSVKEANQACQIKESLKLAQAVCSETTFELLKNMLQKNPFRRIDAMEALEFIIQKDKSFLFEDSFAADYNEEMMDEGPKNF